MELVDHGQDAKFLFQEFFVFLRVAEGDLQQKIKLTRQVQADLYFGVPEHGGAEVAELAGAVPLQFDQRDDQCGAADEPAVEDRGIAADVACFLQPADTFIRGRRRFEHPACDMDYIHAAVLLQQAEDPQVGGVKCIADIHRCLAGYPGVQRIIVYAEKKQAIMMIFPISVYFN